jgi:hypothetical protein
MGEQKDILLTMKSFKQYIQEKRIELMSIPYRSPDKVDMIPGLENPSSAKELTTFVIKKTKIQEARFLIHKKTGRFLVWDSYRATHWEVTNGEEGDPAAYAREEYWEGTVETYVVAGNDVWLISINKTYDSDKIVSKTRALKQLASDDKTTVRNTW